MSAVGSNATFCIESAEAPDLVPSTGQYAAGTIYQDSACTAGFQAGVAVKQDACVPLEGAGFPVYGERLMILLLCRPNLTLDTGKAACTSATSGTIAAYIDSACTTAAPGTQLTLDGTCAPTFGFGVQGSEYLC